MTKWKKKKIRYKEIMQGAINLKYEEKNDEV